MILTYQIFIFGGFFMRGFFKGAVSFALLFIYIFSCFSLPSYAVLTENDGGRAILSTKGDAASRVSSRILEALTQDKTASKKKTDKPLLLIPCGDVFGIKISEENPTVTKVKHSGAFAVGDKILEIDGTEMHSIKDIESFLSNCEHKKLEILVSRDGKELLLSVNPSFEYGRASLDISLKDTSVGIGTITYINPESCEFGGLGHAVSEADGDIVKIRSAIASSVILTGIKRGESGKPGELSGALGRGLLGKIYTNCECGVFGVLNSKPLPLDDALPVGKRNELCEGRAEIISTLKNGKKMSFDIEISDIDYSSSGSKSFKIKVTDDALLAISGGIVRGMSGSPIIQDGKLVGAVTHVMVANPTEGYGIFIENMLNAASDSALPKAA
jgi:stage IV sporulation protein B